MLITILSFVFVFTILALAHELGHFYFARRAGIRVHEFGFGFGPRLFAVKRGDTVFSLNLVPILAFVRIAGADTEGSTDEDDRNTPENEKFYGKSIKDRFLSMVAGPVANLLVAFIVLTLVFAFVGVPKNITNEIGAITKKSAAEAAGLKIGDKVISIDGKKYASMDKIIEKIHKSSGKELTLGIERDGKEIFIKAAPQYNKRLKVGLIGFAPKPSYERVNPLMAIYYGGHQVVMMSVMTVSVLLMLFTGKVSLADLAGPVGIAQITGQYAQSGMLSLLHFLALLNVNIGILNLLPLPALDGGRIVFLAIEAVRKKAIDPALENKIHQWGLILLLGLMAVVTLNDLVRIFRS
ncbi:RIP metalloprotease RseP [candidate division WOR-1 bacterium RIFOXYA12_FULL_43_27]|uniref:Zinc metalloprotease n=1 Tax=candidate division WOR-1 bacterium RIFOXYC2_FULL_46_14 TaxID=1802587 RepID=A0A1F4U4Y7_UNCSA|nr:MAG: RIP metalloprotease RseP [candidate division WOR-1 bacterium RIFOXYA12_FULL_43_27]OGC20788.1 MAG: RIP metalloprotease RseP [candidate division WOR-1 bacterium RIFOXYB2_FULL_46_45]OGC31475.1 MAG: RIP metalloprotease RseP [candidate division WOR-1 bacterium RIFOXYA2_FULL_46_56]OGC39880.1 MAG: RIP metalloprotease RseP [candidate division WOR-1 bacterium RIFOXYC2_FULL_46_14]